MLREALARTRGAIHRRRFPVIAAGSFLFAAAGLLWMLGPRGLHRSGPDQGEPDLTRRTRCTKSGSPMGCMWKIEGGTFQMGAQREDPRGVNYVATARDDEGPVHSVTLPTFFIHGYEVSAYQFLLCVRAGRCALADVAPERGGYFNYDDQKRWSHPMNGVSWNGADAYCRWIGGRLPTEAEWEYASRGPEDGAYPWGRDPPTCPQVIWDNGCGSGTTIPWPPDTYPLANMAGNVWEWVSDWYDPTYYARSPARDPHGPDSPVKGFGRVQRGGSFSSTDPDDLRRAARAQLDPGSRLYDVGFRCVRDYRGWALEILE